MKNKRFLFGLLAITLVLGMTAVGCGDTGGGGSFTLTDIPAEYEGLYAGIEAYSQYRPGFNLAGASSINYKKETVSFPRIKNGKVSINMFVVDSYNKTVEDYDGDDILQVGVIFFNSNDPSDDTGEGRQFNSVQFSKGSAAKSWDEGVYKALDW